jgi:serine/threonine protein kinase
MDSDLGYLVRDQ